MAQILINGEAYTHKQVQIVYLGIPLYSVSTLEYREEQEKENNFGNGGNYAHSRGRSQKNASGSIEMSMNEIEIIRDALPNGSLLDAPMDDIVITFLNPQKPVTHVVKNMEWLTDVVSSTQGDKDVKISNDFIASHIKWR